MDESLSGNILILSHEPATREHLAALLASQGYLVAVASDDTEALAQAAGLFPDLILLDDQMADAEEVCQRLCANPALAEVPMVIIIPPVDHMAYMQRAGHESYTSITTDKLLLAWVKMLAHLNRHRRSQQYQEALCESEEQCRTLVGVMPQGVLCCDAEGNIILANPAARRILNLTPDQIQDRPPPATNQQTLPYSGYRWPGEELPTAATSSLCEEVRSAVVKIFDPVRQEFRWIESNPVPLFRPGESKPYLVYNILEDLTQQMKAEAELRQKEARFRSTVEQASDGIALTDEQGRIVEWNLAQERITGLRREDVLGLPILDAHFRLIPAERNTESFRELLTLSLQEFFSTGQAPWLNQPLEYEIVRPDGTRRVVQTTLFPVQVEKGFTIGSITRDITEWIEAQNEINRRNRESAALNEIIQAINSTLDVQETLTLITTSTNRLMNTEATSILLYDEERDDLYFAAGSGPGADFLIGRRLQVGQGIAGWVVEHNEPALVPDVSQDPRWFSEFDAESGFITRSLLCVPLRSKGLIVGALETMNKEGGFNQDDVRLLSTLAASAATAIENARLFEQARDRHAQLQALSRHLVEIQEAERAHVARELHDETGQALSSLLLSLSMLEQEASNPRAVRKHVANLKTTVNGMLEDLHQLATNLRPAALDLLGLVPALEQYIETFSEQHAIPIQFETVGPVFESRLPPEVEIALYRIVQEALTNVLRHAQATRIDVLLEQRGSQVVAIIEDDGVGFDAEAARQSGRLGLLGMRERAEMLGGQLTIESAPGMGTTIYVEIPYAHPYPDRR